MPLTSAIKQHMERQMCDSPMDLSGYRTTTIAAPILVKKSDHTDKSMNQTVVYVVA